MQLGEVDVGIPRFVGRQEGETPIDPLRAVGGSATDLIERNVAGDFFIVGHDGVRTPFGRIFVHERATSPETRDEYRAMQQVHCN